MSPTPPLQVTLIPVTPFEQNCSLVWCTATMKGAVIDPGGDLERVEEVVAQRGISLEKILLTHGHLDHAGAAADLAERRGVPIEGPQREDAFLIADLSVQGRRFGMTHCRPCTPDRWLQAGDRVTVGQQTLEVYHCPGHTPGHLVFFHRDMKVAFVGDVLFKGSIGRTDLPRGDQATLIRSITGQLWPLGADVTFVPGHGPTSTFGFERQYNPYVGDRAAGF